MPRPAISSALRVIAVTIAATLGALVGFGMRSHAAWLLLSTAGERLRGVPSIVATESRFGLGTMIGAVHHVLLVTLWTMAFWAIARRARPAMVLTIAASCAVVAMVVDPSLPGALRVAAGETNGAERAIYGSVLGVALWVGGRLAQSADRGV